ncbi:endonuclease domain-containing protein [Kitasatospora sp. NPDC036755]|uniref:endonuclease domain-containing protein n=1 Tax=Kitasatospora sp. NPDC036755 TaxID=3154600 RepID=UPI003408280D
MVPELARRDETRTGLFHLWDPQWGARGMSTLACPRFSGCTPLAPEHLGEPIMAALVPPAQRCGGPSPWPTYVQRAWDGPLPERWDDEVIPRWYVWWRLFELQGGRCACCLASPTAIDHDHRTGLVRGLLCTSCNSLEAACFRRDRMCIHPPPHCFNAYWRNPPALLFGWLWHNKSSFRLAPWTGGPAAAAPRRRASS